MINAPGHVKGVRSPLRNASRDASRRSGLPSGAAFAIIRKDIQELRRQTLRPPIEPAALEQRLHELATQIGAVQGTMPGGAGLDAFLQQLKELLAQNLAVLERQVAMSAAAAISGPAESIRRDVASLKEIQASVDRRTQDTFEAVYGTIERIVDRLAAIEDGLQERNSGPQADYSSTPPLDDWGPGMPAVGSGLAAEAPAPVPAGQSARMVVLRQPAAPDGAFDAVPRQESVNVEPDRQRSRFLGPIGAGLEAARRACRALANAPGAAPVVPAGTFVRTTSRPQRKAAVLGVGAGLLVLFGVTLALDLYRASPERPAEPLPVAATAAEADQTDDAQAPAAEPPSDRPSSRQEASLEPPPSVPSHADPLADGAASAAVPAEPAAAAAVPLPADAMRGTDALMQSVLLPAPAGSDPWAQSGADLTMEPLPPTIGSKALLTAAAAGDAGASYEIAIRFAQGRNAPPDFARAAAWMERAARAGLAPAQFRLGSMYERGLGVRKDLAEARRLYVAAAAKGHTKAMHNLAVLYAGGIDGAPDYGAAVEWFRKAAAYGTIDSQYNLGILYARGTGVGRDLAESYKWFALAAKGGDKDAARKRDEVARGLDARQLESAKASVEAFAALPQPDEATVIKAPAGGRGQLAAAATTKSRTLARPERFPGK